jgi:hypothetical protein
MTAVKKRWPKMLVQFEDFNTELAFELLDEWRDKQCCFNDDVDPQLDFCLMIIDSRNRLSRPQWFRQRNSSLRNKTS